jgi:hypothetical protein
MSATRTHAPLGGTTAETAYAAGHRWGYQDADQTRQSIDVLAYIGDAIQLGGHQAIGYVTGAATWEAVDPSFTYSLNGSTLGGMTLDLVVTSWTENAAQSVQVRLRNTTDSSNAAISTSHSGTSATLETVTGVTLAAGIKSYRLEILGGATYAVFTSAYLRIRDIAA